MVHVTNELRLDLRANGEIPDVVDAEVVASTESKRERFVLAQQVCQYDAL